VSLPDKPLPGFKAVLPGSDDGQGGHGPHRVVQSHSRFGGGDSSQGCWREVCSLPSFLMAVQPDWPGGCSTPALASLTEDKERQMPRGEGGSQPRAPPADGISLLSLKSPTNKTRPKTADLVWVGSNAGYLKTWKSTQWRKRTREEPVQC
jgi:hypothetical protein